MKAASAVHRLTLLRHGKALRSRPGESDFDRALDPQGIADAGKLGAYLVRHRLVPDRVVVSPAVRARETWTQAAAACPPAPAATYDPRLYDAKVDAILAVIGETADATSILVVGHNPGLHDLAMWLIASGDVETRERLRENLPTTGLVVIDFAIEAWSKLHPQSGRLELFLEPEALDAAVD